MDDIPDIYTDSYSSKKNNLEKINLIDDNIYNLIHEKYGNLTIYQLFDIPDNTKCIIVGKTNYKKEFEIDTSGGIFNIYNNRIYFARSTDSITFSFKNNNKDLLDNSYCKQSILILYKYVINNYKYNIISIDGGDLSDYKEDIMFEKKYNNNNNKYYIFFTFTLNIISKIKKKILKLPKILEIKSQEFIFVYESQLNANNTIVLYLIKIKNINTDESIKIDIKFMNIESIYQKYEIAIDQVNTFLFEKNTYLKYKIDIENNIKNNIKKYNIDNIHIYPDKFLTYL